MTNKNIIYQFSILVFLVMSYGCHPRTNENINVSSKIEAVKTVDATNKQDDSKESLSVIYRSQDLGKTWSSFAKGIPEDATLSGIKQYGKNIYVTTDYHGIFVTSDGRNNWTSLNIENTEQLDINCIEVEENNIIIGTLKNGIFTSKDKGLTWEQSEINFNTPPIRAFIKSEKKLYIGTDSGIFESIDMGHTWSHAFGQIQILGFTSLNNKIYAATQNGALVCKENSSNWKSIYEGDALHDISNDGQYIYIMTIGQQLLKTQNDGELWENAQNGIAMPTNYYTNELQHIGKDIFSAQWIGIYHSSDNGRNWEILSGLPDSTAFSTLEITDFGIIAGISIR